VRNRNFLKMCVSEICVKRIRVKQGLGVHYKLLHVKIHYPIYTTLCWRLNLLSMRPESWEKDFLWLQNIEFAPIWPQLIHLCKSKLDWVRRLAQRLKEHTYHSFSHTIYCHERMISACFIGSYETGKLGQVAGAGN
jgi:hypothetical protein